MATTDILHIDRVPIVAIATITPVATDRGRLVVMARMIEETTVLVIDTAAMTAMGVRDTTIGRRDASRPQTGSHPSRREALSASVIPPNLPLEPDATW